MGAGVTAPSVTGDDTSTRDRLINAAERLLAQRGVDAASLREITREAGARNAVAIQYHFGDRAGLIGAVLAKHLPPIEAYRHELLDAYEAEQPPGIRPLAAALVRPYAIKLTDRSGGPEFLQVYAGLLNRPDPVIEPAGLHDPGSSVYRWRLLVDPLLDDNAVRLHRRFTAMSHTITELGRRARDERRRDHQLFTSYLIDNVAAILGAETSDETRDVMAARRR